MIFPAIQIRHPASTTAAASGIDPQRTTLMLAGNADRISTAQPPAPETAGTHVSLSQAARERLTGAAGTPSAQEGNSETDLAHYARLGSRPPPPSMTHDRAYQRMLDRLYDGKEPSGINTDSAVGWDDRSPLDFLTKTDRLMMAEIYQYAEEARIDIRHVDDLAHALGGYRQSDDGRRQINFNSGGMYDAQWRPQTVAFTAAEAQVVNRILDGKAIGTTRLDQGFLRFQLDPGYSALGRHVDFSFLEKVVQRFSASPASPETPDHALAPYRVKEWHEVAAIHSHEEGRLPMPEEPHLIRIKDQWVITERGKAAGYTMDDIMGKGHQAPHSRHQRALMAMKEGFPIKALDEARAEMIEQLLQAGASESRSRKPLSDKGILNRPGF
ncbi:MAG: hypothetical protein Q4B17_10335 [Lautropia sp.]|nr:hypothetical protein [Lautropia sp.]